MTRLWGGPQRQPFFGVRLTACVRANDVPRHHLHQHPSCFVSAGRPFSTICGSFASQFQPSRRPLLFRRCFSDTTTAYQVQSSPLPNSNLVSLDRQVSVTCLPGLEPILIQEIRALGLEVSQHNEELKQKGKSGRNNRRGEVVLKGTRISPNDLFRACFYLGTATNIRVRCGQTFNARGLPELRRKTALLAWTDILLDPIVAKLRLRIRATSSKSKLYHTAAIRERVLQGILDAFGYSNIDNDIVNEILNFEHTDQTGTSMLDGPMVQLEVLISHDQVDIFVNASPIPLHQRGYRLQTAKAPLREDLAFALLLAVGWMPTWFRKDTTVHDESGWTGLLDPFCGSGTIAIEGAAMAMGLPPGRLRNGQFFQGTVWNDELFHDWTRYVQATNLDARNANGHSVTVRVAASDRNAGAIQATRSNAERAGVLEWVNIQEVALSAQPWLEDPSAAPTSLLVVTNPPFGKRVSPQPNLSSSLPSRGGKNQYRTSEDGSRHLLPLYQTLGHRLMKFASKPGRRARAMVLMDNPRLLNRAGLPLSMETLFQSTHGGLPISAVRVDVLSDAASTKS